MTSFQQFQDDNPEFDDLLTSVEPYDMPDWMLQTADFEPNEQRPSDIQPLIFE